MQVIKDDTYYMRKAIKRAQENVDNFELPFACCLVVGGEQIITSNTCLSTGDPTCHSEMNAIRDLYLSNIEDKKDITIYCNIEPCIMCMGAINWTRIKKVVYGLSLKKSMELGFAEVSITSEELKDKFPYNINIVGGVLEDECMNVIKSWEKKERFYKLILKKDKR